MGTGILPAGIISNREVLNGSVKVEADKLQHLYKLIANFEQPIGGGAVTQQVATRAKVGAAAGWVVAAADNLPYVATLPASQTGSTLIVPLDGLPIGATITGFRAVAQIESAAGTVTLDCDLRATTNVLTDPTDASIGAMTQVSVTADTAVSQEKTGLAEVVTSGKSYYFKFTATTAASTDIILQHCEITYTLPTLPVSRELLLHVADKAGTLTDVGAGLNVDGSSTSITVDLKKNGTTMLAAPIALTNATGDRVEVAGSITGNGSYVAGDVFTAILTVTSAVGASGPWLRVALREDGE